MDSKDDPVPSQNQGVPHLTQDLDYPQKFLLRVVAHQGNQNPSFFLASPNLGDKISFKGGSL
jgi:hypothetical protein